MQQLKLKAGSPVDPKIEKGHLVLLPQKYDLEEMLAQITDENSHHEFFEAPPQGQEEG